MLLTSKIAPKKWTLPGTSILHSGQGNGAGILVKGTSKYVWNLKEWTLLCLFIQSACITTILLTRAVIKFCDKATFILSRGIRNARRSEFENSRILNTCFGHPRVIVFPDPKCVQEALLSAAFSPPKCVSGSAFCMRKGAAKLATPYAVTYLLFPTFPSVCSASRWASHSRNSRWPSSLS